MKINRIILKDIGKIDSLTLDFGNGLNLVYGENYKGKTTVVNAIFFCLIGKHLLGSGKGKHLARQGTKSGTIGLIFEKETKVYRLFRATDLKIELRGEDSTVLGRGKETSDILKGIFPQEYYRLSIPYFLREGEITEFLLKGGTTRKEMLQSLLGVEEIVKTLNVSIGARRAAKREEKRLKEYVQSIGIESIDVKKREKKELEEHIKDRERKLDILRKGIVFGENISLIEEVESSKEKLKRELMELKKEREAIGEDEEGLAGLIERIEEETKESKDEEELEGILLRKARIEYEIEGIKNSKPELKRILEAGKTVCPTCKQPINKEFLTNILCEQETRGKSLAGEIDELSKREIEKRKRLKKIAELKEKRYEIRKKLDNRRRVDGNIKKKEEEYSSLEEKTAHLKSDIKDYEDLRRSKRNWEELKGEIDALRNRLTELTRESALIEEKIKESKTQEKALEHAMRVRLRSEALTSALEETIREIMRDILIPVEKQIDKAMPHFRMLPGATTDIHSKDLLPTVGKREALTLSGSEKMILYLSMKVALGNSLGDVDFFILDDPTLHLDTERKGLFLKFLESIPEDKQVIVFSNDDYILEKGAWARKVIL